VSDAFRVTAATPAIELDPSRAAEARFTVSNRTGHPVRARAVPLPAGETQASWLLVAGEAERDMPVDGTDEFVVGIAVPVGVAGGTYGFKLHVVSVTLPDEEWGESELVSVSVPEPPTPPPPPTPEEPPGYLETLAGALVGAFVVGLILGGIGLALAVGVDIDTGGSSGGSLGEAIGRLFAQGIALLVILAVAVILFGALGFWFGPVIGAALVLRARGFRDPWRTALPMVLLIPLIGLPLLLLFARLSDVLGMESLAQTLVGFFGIALGVTAASLLARAYARWRQTGHL
jgi:hypothetical protein